MKEPIEPSDIREGDLIRWQLGAGTVSTYRAVEYKALRDGHQQNSSGAYFLLERPKPAVVLPTEPTLGWLTADRCLAGETPISELARWHRVDDDVQSIQWDGRDCGIARGWVTAFTPATAIPTDALDRMRRVAATCDATYPDYKEGIFAFLAAVDAASAATS